MLFSRQGAVILDDQRQIQVVTPVAEDLLGWETDHVMGMACPLIFDCRDTDGGSMCDRCGFADALRGKEITQPLQLEMADAFGGRRRVMMSFWYLPPAGRFVHPRVMAILNDPEPRPEALEAQ